MPSRPLEQVLRVALAACLLLGSGSASPETKQTLGGPVGMAARPSPPGRPVAAPAVRQALATLRDDPNVSRGDKSWVLTWVQHDTAQRRRPSEWKRFAAIVGSMGEALRVVLWVLAALGAGLLAVYLTRLAQLRATRGRLTELTRPTHVQELDIRPQSLPADVGAAALALWERGEARAALALLYRATLSRLVHVHGAAIRASSTEEECAEAAAARLNGPALDFVRGLIGVWQQAVYGGAAPPKERFQGLCAELDSALRARVAA